MIYGRTFYSPLGNLLLTASDDALTGVFFNAQGVANDSNQVLELASKWLADYFAGAGRNGAAGLWPGPSLALKRRGKI